jgi:C4-dicarboxylate-specific signal transduction histidine kinase
MFQTLSVLHVEDEKQLRGVIASLFSKWFKNFYSAQDGQEGLELYQEHRDKIDLIITDIHMPRMDGLEMCQAIRQSGSDIPIIITTAFNDNEYLHRAIEVGVSSFAVKPINMQNLIDLIQKDTKSIILQQKIEEEKERHQEELLANAKFAAIGQLAAGITHEINTPLTYIKASFEILGYDLEDMPESKMKTDAQKQLERITDGLLRIENIINSMKEMSSQSKVEKKEMNIYSTIITSTVLAYNKSKHISKIFINGKEFYMDMDKNEHAFLAHVQPQRIEQVWVIIINNAIDELIKIDKFSDRKLEIILEEDDEFVYVYFKDNAGGIDEDLFDSLFKPFKGTKESGGMGVGLSIAQKIINDQSAGSTIEAYNEEDGAVFKVSLLKRPN